MGMSNSAVSRLSQTWDKLPSKFRKLFTEFEALIDPSRNHRAYRYELQYAMKLYPSLTKKLKLTNFCG